MAEFQVELWDSAGTFVFHNTRMHIICTYTDLPLAQLPQPLKFKVNFIFVKYIYNSYYQTRGTLTILQLVLWRHPIRISAGLSRQISYFWVNNRLDPDSPFIIIRHVSFYVTWLNKHKTGRVGPAFGRNLASIPAGNWLSDSSLSRFLDPTDEYQRSHLQNKTHFTHSWPLSNLIRRYTECLKSNSLLCLAHGETEKWCTW